MWLPDSGVGRVGCSPVADPQGFDPRETHGVLQSPWVEATGVQRRVRLAQVVRFHRKQKFQRKPITAACATIFWSSIAIGGQA